MKAHPTIWLAMAILACSTLFAITPASQTVRAAGSWYVAPGGSDANTCAAPGAACASINGALNKPGFVVGDTVLVAAGVYTGAGEQVILLDRNATLSGGWDAGFATQGGTSTIDGQRARRGMTVWSGITAVVERFAIQNGYNNITNEGTLTLNNCAVQNGRNGILNKGTLTLNNSIVSGNTTDGSGGGIYNLMGSLGTLTLNNSTVSGNTANDVGGGILNEYRQMTLNNSTVSGNRANDLGGGIHNSGGTAILNNSTVSANTAGEYGGGIYNWDGAVNLQNSILGDNTAASGPDCSGAVIGSAGYNLVGSIAGCTFSASTGDLTTVSARIGLLIGSPGYLPLLSASPAINAGNPAGCIGSTGPLTTDQRGAARVGRCDIGAYEYTVPGPAARVSTFGGTPQTAPPSVVFRTPLKAAVVDGIGSPVNSATVSFLAPASGASGTFADSGTLSTTAVTAENGVATAAIFTANGQAGSYTVLATVESALTPASFLLTNRGWYVSFDGNDVNDCQTPTTSCATVNGALNKPGIIAGDAVLVATGVYTGAGDQVILLARDVTLSGGWDASFTEQSGMSTIDGQGARRGMTVDFGITAVVERFIIQNGIGGIYNNCGSPGHLTLNDSTISGNTTDGAGGGIYNYGPATLNNTIVSGNSASSGGGIFNNNYASITLNNSNVSGNTASEYGGGIRDYSGKVTLSNSTVNDNTAWQGGGIYTYQGGVMLNNSTVSTNTGTSIGGGIYTWEGAVTLQNSILSGNAADSAPDCAGGTIGSAGYNLVGDTSGCTFGASTGDLTNVDARLGLLIGSPGYLPLLSDSPAIDAGNPDGCTGSSGPLTTDQRGAARVGRCDIGAYEYTIPGPAAKVRALRGTPQTTPPSFVFRMPFQASVVDSIGSPVNGVTVHFSAPASGASGMFADSATFTTSTVTAETGLATAATFTANELAGSYTVTAAVNGAVVPANFLLANRAWYVVPGGNDANGCLTPAKPCATINGALNKPGFVADDTILVGTGVYSGTGTQVVLLNKNATLSGGWNAAFTMQSGASTIDGQDARRGMTVDFGRTAIVERFAVQNGNGGSSGGGIRNRGTLTLNNSTVSGNAVSSGEYYGAGGGIYNDGAATLNNCTVSGNTNDMYGGGIFNGQGTLTLNNSTVSGNKGNYGGGIFGEGIVVVQNSVVRDNDGFGIYKHGGTATLNNSAISGNRSGGIYNDGGTVTINHSAVGGNTTSGSGAGIINGGGWDAGTVTLDNSTVSGNTANEYCGGIVNGGTLTLNNSTVSGNGATLSGGGICNDNANATLRNSILSGNSASSAPDCRGAIGSAGYNLIGNTSGCTFSATGGDLIGVDPKLGPLEGSPGYQPLLPGSPAVNGGNPAGCKDEKGNPLPTDQKGLPRFGRCDIGSYELQPIGFSTLTVNRAVVLPGDPLTYTFVLNNPGATDIADARVTDTLPVSLSYIDNSLTATSGSASYQSGVITWSGTINAGGSVTVTYGATVNPTLGFIINPALISGGGDSVTRTATVTVDGPICNLTKHTGNPVLVAGADGSWDDRAVWGPAVLKEGSSYKMWYTGDDGTNPSRIGLATSNDGTTWTKAATNPVLSPSQAWEAKGIRAGSIISDDGLYKMWYTGLDSSGDSRIGYATSPDGVNWTKYGSNPVLYTGNWGSWEDKGVEKPTVFKEGSTYHLWYTGNDGMTLRIGHATSSDGINWTKDPANPVLDIGSPGAWDWLNVYGSSVIKVGAEYKLWYSGQTLPHAWQTGYALSSNGSAWTRGTMLILEGSSGAFDAVSADYPSVLVDGDKFKIWYSGLNKGGDQTIGYATAGICRGAAVPSGRPVYLPLVVKSPQVPCPAYYTDNFGDSDSGWPVDDDSNRRYAYTGGEYQIWAKKPHQGWSVTPGAKVTDFAAAVSARRTSGSLGAYGIQFGINEYWSQFYEFIVENASYGIWRYDNGSWTALQGWTVSGHISTGTNWNRLKVIRNGASMSVYANGQLLATVSDNSFTGLRWIGLVAYSPDASGLDAHFDGFSLYPAVCGASAANAAAVGFEMREPRRYEVPVPPGLGQLR